MGFGDLAYLHLVDSHVERRVGLALREGWRHLGFSDEPFPAFRPPEEQAQFLLEVMRCDPVKRVIPPRVIKLAALELAAHAGLNGQPLSRPLLELLAECMGLPTAVLDTDGTLNFYQGLRFTDERHAEAYDATFSLFLNYLVEKKRLMPLETARKEIEKRLGWAPDRKQLREWRDRFEGEVALKE